MKRLYLGRYPGSQRLGRDLPARWTRDAARMPFCWPGAQALAKCALPKPWRLDSYVNSLGPRVPAVPVAAVFCSRRVAIPTV